MKKIGWLSFFIYLFNIGFGLHWHIESALLIKEIQASPGGFQGRGYPLGKGIGLMIVIIGLILLVLKLLHMSTGWAFFGVLALLIDLIVLAALLIIFRYEEKNIVFGIICALPMICATSNFLSLFDR